MKERDYWVHLEYRVCREIDRLRVSAPDDLRDLWCDGFVAQQLETVDGRLRYSGYTWMGRGGRHQEKWRFELLLPPGIRDSNDVDWAAVFPAEDVSGWLSLDTAGHSMKVDPAAARRKPPVVC